MDDTWDITEDGEQDVYKQVAAAATLEKDTDRWQEDGEDDFQDVAKMKGLSVSSPTDRGIAGMQAGSPNLS